VIVKAMVVAMVMARIMMVMIAMALTLVVAWLVNRIEHVLCICARERFVIKLKI
jgi:hypothetical protein